MTDPAILIPYEDRCQQCHGHGKLSKYDMGWKSLMHDDELAAKTTLCFYCMGTGREPEER